MSSPSSIGIAAASGVVELLDQALGRHADDGERLVDLMRHAGRHFAEMGDARRIEQPDLGQPALAVVDGDHHDVAQAALFILDGIGGNLDDALGTVDPDELAFVLERLEALRTASAPASRRARHRCP